MTLEDFCIGGYDRVECRCGGWIWVGGLILEIIYARPCSKNYLLGVLPINMPQSWYILISHDGENIIGDISCAIID